jgi:hypothetical protein
MSYQAYHLLSYQTYHRYEAERARSGAGQRQAGGQLGRLMADLSRLRRGSGRAARVMRVRASRVRASRGHN